MSQVDPLPKKLTSILNRLGHSESNDFGLELETSLTKALDQSSTHLTSQIIKGEGDVVFHCEWDNLNKTTTNLLGSSIVNSAGGIMLQEVRPGFDNVCARTLPVYRKSNQHSHSVDTPATLVPLNFNRIGPNFPDGCTFHMLEAAEFNLCLGLVGLYLLLEHHQLESLPLIILHQSITDNSVVRELLKHSEEASIEVGQKWVISTFDLGVCMKALPIIWRWPEEFQSM